MRKKVDTTPEPVTQAAVATVVAPPPSVQTVAPPVAAVVVPAKSARAEALAEVADVLAKHEAVLRTKGDYRMDDFRLLQRDIANIAG